MGGVTAPHAGEKLAAITADAQTTLLKMVFKMFLRTLR
jgi:hypothetical protein